MEIYYEFEQCDNGYILAEPAIRQVQISDPKRGGIEYQLGQTLLDELKDFLRKNETVAVGIKVTLKEIKPKY